MPTTTRLTCQVCRDLPCYCHAIVDYQCRRDCDEVCRSCDATCLTRRGMDCNCGCDLHARRNMADWYSRELQAARDDQAQECNCLPCLPAGPCTCCAPDRDCLAGATCHESGRSDRCDCGHAADCPAGRSDPACLGCAGAPCACHCNNCGQDDDDCAPDCDAPCSLCRDDATQIGAPADLAYPAPDCQCDAPGRHYCDDATAAIATAADLPIGSCQCQRHGLSAPAHACQVAQDCIVAKARRHAKARLRHINPDADRDCPDCEGIGLLPICQSCDVTHDRGACKSCRHITGFVARIAQIDRDCHCREADYRNCDCVAPRRAMP